MREHSLVSGCGILLVEGARRGRAIDPNIGVVDNLRVAGTKFQSFHVAEGLDRQRKDEDARDIRPARL